MRIESARRRGLRAAALLLLTGPAALAQTTLSFREGSNGYTHAGTFIRGDGSYSNVNSGARDQVLVGRTSAGLRPVFSFGLSAIPTGAVVTGVSLDLWTLSTNSLGTVGALELHALPGTPVEGTGDGSGSGAGSGATWISRDGQTGPGHAWAAPGGDFSAPVLSSVPGYDATLPNTQRTFASRAAFVAAAQAAVSQGQPLNLLIRSPTTEAGANNIYSRIASDDNPAAAWRPRLTVTYATEPAPAGLTATPISRSEVALHWHEALTNEAGFVVDRMTGPTGAWAAVITTGPDVTNVTNAGLEPATVYSYRVQAVFAGGGGSPFATSSPVTTPGRRTRPPIVVLPLGDSITQGAGAPGGYRGPLLTLLANAGYQIAYVGSHAINPSSNLTAAGNAAHEGHGGYTTMDILNNLDANAAGPSANNGGHWLDGLAGTRDPVYPDVILLMAGTNDLGVNQLTPEQALAGLDALLAKLATMRPDALLVVATLIPYLGTVYPDREQHQRDFNAALPGLVAAHQGAGRRIALYDMRTKVNATNAAALLGADGVHPNQAGYDALALGWYEAFQALPLIENWRRSHFGSPDGIGLAADAADGDGDRQPNLVEYGLGTDPTVAPSGNVAQAGILADLGVAYLGLSFPRRRHADVSCVVELSPDLVTWAAGAVQVGPAIALDDTLERVTVRDHVPLRSAGSRFLRLTTSR